MPWKNGGGITTEVAISPPGAQINEFDWRISMAQIAADGGFSAFPGTDRTLCILEGEGIHLSVLDMPEIGITPDTQPYSFPADAPAYARLIGGPVVDLNVMTRRGCFIHRMTRLRSAATVAWKLNADVTVLFTYSARLRVNAGADSEHLAQRDTVVFGKQDGTIFLSSDSPSEAYIIEFDGV